MNTSNVLLSPLSLFSTTGVRFLKSTTKGGFKTPGDPIEGLTANVFQDLHPMEAVLNVTVIEENIIGQRLKCIAVNVAFEQRIGVLGVVVS